jgi:methionine-rich copper-binding protein CopC
MALNQPQRAGTDEPEFPIPPFDVTALNPIPAWRPRRQGWMPRDPTSPLVVTRRRAARPSVDRYVALLRLGAEGLAVVFRHRTTRLRRGRQGERTGRMSRFIKRRRAAAACLLTMVAIFGVATTAAAHAWLVDTDPANGSRARTPPGSVTLSFSQPVLPIGAAVRVVGPSGNIAKGKPVVRGRQVRQALKPGPGGDYRVMWRVTSIDGHPISATFRYSVRDQNTVKNTPDVTSNPASTAPASSPLPASAAARTTAVDGSDDRSTVPWLIVTGVVMLAAVILAVLLLVWFRNRSSNADRTRSGTT